MVDGNFVFLTRFKERWITLLPVPLHFEERRFAKTRSRVHSEEEDCEDILYVRELTRIRCSANS